jgi:small subunit ribosomal protein S16
MLKIRLQRIGRKHEPVFRVVVTESQNSTKSGRFLEVVGSHDPRFSEKTQLNKERISHWISKGAQPSGTIHNMLVDAGVVQGKKINVLPKKTPPKKEAPAAEASAPAGEAPAPEQAPDAAPSENAPADAAPAETPTAETPAEKPVENPAA